MLHFYLTRFIEIRLLLCAVNPLAYKFYPLK